MPNFALKNSRASVTVRPSLEAKMSIFKANTRTSLNEYVDGNNGHNWGLGAGFSGGLTIGLDGAANIPTSGDSLSKIDDPDRERSENCSPEVPSSATSRLSQMGDDM